MRVTKGIRPAVRIGTRRTAEPEYGASIIIPLPHYSGYQYRSGRQVPVAGRQPGDMLFFANDGVIGHVALYVGNGMMIEAPYSGSAVRLVPMRTAGLMPFVTRML